MTIDAVSTFSRATETLGKDTMDKARVVGIPSACIASEQRYSRMEERRTARPSALREKGVRPEPFSWSSVVWSGFSGVGLGVTTVTVIRGFGQCDCMSGEESRRITEKEH